MTLAPEHPHNTRHLPEVAVRFSPDGTPLAVRHDGKIWMADPALHTNHWYSRDAWWETRDRAPRGTGDVVSVEHWQFQAQSQGLEATLQLRREPLSEQWLLESLSHDTTARVEESWA